MSSIFRNPEGARVGLIAVLVEESPWDVDELELRITKVIEQHLNKCGISWGPQAAEVDQPYGWTVAYDAPGAWTEIDVIRPAECVVVTIWIDDLHLWERVWSDTWDLTGDTSRPELEGGGVYLDAGRSNPDTGLMADMFTVWDYEYWRKAAFEEYDGSLVDEDGSPLEDVDEDD